MPYSHEYPTKKKCLTSCKRCFCLLIFPTGSAIIWLGGKFSPWLAPAPHYSTWRRKGLNMAKHWNVVVNYGSLSDDTFFTDNWLDVVAKIADLNDENIVELSSIQIFKIDDSILKLFDKFLPCPAQDDNDDFCDYPLYCPAPPDVGDLLPDDYFEGWW